MAEHRDEAGFREILAQLHETGFKKSPLRLAYEREVHDLARVREALQGGVPAAGAGVGLLRDHAEIRRPAGPRL